MITYHESDACKNRQSQLNLGCVNFGGLRGKSFLDNRISQVDDIESLAMTAISWCWERLGYLEI